MVMGGPTCGINAAGHTIGIDFYPADRCARAARKRRSLLGSSLDSGRLVVRFCHDVLRLGWLTGINAAGYRGSRLSWNTACNYPDSIRALVWPVLPKFVPCDAGAGDWRRAL